MYYLKEMTILKAANQPVIDSQIRQNWQLSRDVPKFTFSDKEPEVWFMTLHICNDIMCFMFL